MRTEFDREPLSFWNRNYRKVQILGAISASLFLGSTTRADALSTNSETTINGALVKSRLSFNPASGLTRCMIEKKDKEINFGSQSVVLRVESKNQNNVWRVEKSFQQPYAQGLPNPNHPHEVTTKLKTTYNPDDLTESIGNGSTRISCLSTDTELSLKIPKQLME